MPRPLLISAGQFSRVILWQANPDRRATGSEDWKAFTVSLSERFQPLCKVFLVRLYIAFCGSGDINNDMG